MFLVVLDAYMSFKYMLRAFLKGKDMSLMANMASINFLPMQTALLVGKNNLFQPQKNFFHSQSGVTSFHFKWETGASL